MDWKVQKNKQYYKKVETVCKLKKDILKTAYKLY